MLSSIDKRVWLVLLLLVKIQGKIVPRIVNGSNAQIGQYPYAVSLRYYDRHECGGSIISTRWVLTAAHCIFFEALNDSSILFGTLHSFDGIQINNCTKSIKQAIINENYEAVSPYLNDIALIEVDEPFTFSETIGPLQLPAQGAAVPRGQPSILVGWGMLETNGSASDLLQSVEITIFRDEYCSYLFQQNYSSFSHICAGVPEGGKGQCSGDSGGALTVNGVVQGVVSWSDKPCTITPGVMTRVASFRNWIRMIANV